MELKEILAKCDHTLLGQASTWEDIKAICDDGMKYQTASVCVPASFVKQAKEYVGDRLAICTVIGFPNGYATTAAKCFMASDAVDNGADEVDMVINIGWAKEGKWEDITSEIAAIKAACKGKLLKVIIETCLLTDEEKIHLCKCVSDSGADYIKTSTGFSKAGATFADVELFAKHVAPHVKIKAICDDGMKYKTASVCIPASFVKQAKEYVGDRLAICTVIGFPNGYSTTKVKCLEAFDAVENGADEVDMVINIGWAKDGKWDALTAEIAAIKQHCQGKILKVIIETCLLTDEEKIALCKCVSDSGADYIKTSTGFSKAGATFADVELFAKHVAPHVKIKAAGGISSIADAEQFIALGADRLGTSRIVKIAKGMADDGTY